MYVYVGMYHVHFTFNHEHFPCYQMLFKKIITNDSILQQVKYQNLLKLDFFQFFYNYSEPSRA